MLAHGTVVWNELLTRNIEKAQQYYGKVFGWTFAQAPSGEDKGMYTEPYYMCLQGENVVAGMMDVSAPMFNGTPECWFTYFSVEDLDALVEAVPANGGTVMRPPFGVAGVGRIAIVSDANGAMMGWMQPAAPAAPPE